MPIFEYEGKKYNVQDQHVSQFAKDFPDATSILERDGKKYRVKSADFGSFKEESQPQQQETPTTTSATPNNEEYITGLGQGMKQEMQQIAAGVKYAGGEALDLVTKTAKDNASALAALDKMQAEGKDVAQETKRDAKSVLLPLIGHSAPAIDMVARVFGKKNPIAKANAEVANDKIIRKALEETDGDVEAARALLEQRANKQTTADEWRDEAVQVMNEAKPTKGAGAWVGKMIPQMIGTAAGLGLSAITKSPLPAQILGLGQMGALTASTAGASMKEARDAGATNGEVWATGLADAAIEFATEAIPFKGYLSPLVKQMKSKTGKAIADVIVDKKSPARKELQNLLDKANAQLGGKLFTTENAAKYLDDVLKEGASEFTAEALQAITPMLYAEPENYPTLWEVFSNGIEGLKGGIFMGSVLGGVSNAATNKAQRDRRKEQGFVNVAEVKVSEDSDETTIAEVIDYDDQADRASILINGEIMPLENASKNVVNQEVFTFEEFDRGQVDMEHAESYDRGRNIATPQEKNDALNDLEAQEANIRQRYSLDPDADVYEFMGGDPIAYAMNETDTELRSEILDLVNAKAVYDGMTDGINERIATTIEESDRLIDSHVNKDDNLIHAAILKGVDDNSDRKVYIISGAFARNEDGTIDTTDLAEGASMIVMDATSGKREFIDPRNLKDIAEGINPAEEKQRAAETITNEIATKEEAEIAGTLAFVPNDIYTIADENGVEHTATIVADTQDGNVQVIIDNAQEPMLMPKEKVQQMADAYNIGRANAKIAEKKAQSTVAQSSSEVKPTIPMDEQGKPIYEQAPVEATWAELLSLNDGNAEEAIDTAKIMRDNAKKALEKANKAASAKGDTVEAIQQAKAERKALIDAAQAKYDYWDNVANYQASQPQEVAEPTTAEEQTPIVENASFDENINEVEQVYNEESNERSTEDSDVPASVPAEDGIADGDQASVEMVQGAGTDNTLGDRGSIEAGQGSNESNVGEGVADVPSADVFRAEEVDTATPQLSAKEEMRRKPLRARAKMWEAKVGVPVHLIETFEEVPTKDARKAILDGKVVTAWVTDGEVYLYMPYLRNRTEVDKTYIHEVVAHVGMKRLLGKEGYRQFCMRVYNEVMTEADRKFYDAYPNVKDHAQAADEFIAHLSEDTEMESSIWQKVVRIFRDALRVLGIETALTNKDIQDLLRDSYQNLTNEENVSISESEGTQLRSVYHGSGSDFSKFDHTFMGTGEGHQAFGWGTYVTDVEGIGKQYAKMTSKPRLTFKGEFVDSEELNNPWRIIKDLYDNNHGKLRGMRNDAERIANMVEPDNAEMKELWGNVVRTLSEVRSGDLKITPARYLYSVEIPDNDGTNYLEYGKPLSKTQLNRIKRALYNRLIADTYKGAEQELKEEIEDVFAVEKELDGRDIYGDIATYLGGDKAASEFLNENGYVGISYPADSGNAGKARNYVIFNESDLEIKDSTRFRVKEKAPETVSVQDEHLQTVISSADGTKILKNIDSAIEEVNIRDGVRFRVVEPAPTFYSNAERAAESVKQEKATPEQWLKMIEKNGGLKAGEDKWLGLSDWLKSSDKKTLTKQEVLDFIKENQIQIEEVVYGDIEDNPKFKELEKEYQSYYAETYDSDVAFQRMVDKYGEEFDVAFNGSGMNLYPRNEYGSEDAQKYLGVNEINSTRRQYTTDGLDNKREIALTVPTIESWNESDEIHFGDAGNGRAIAWVRFGETTDADGNRVLVIDEVQSKRHQEGREKGYNNPRVIEIFTRLADIESNLYSPQGLSIEMQSERVALKAELESIFENDNPVMKSIAEQLDEKKSKRTALLKEKSEREVDERVEILKLQAKQDEVRNNRDYDYYESEINDIKERIDQRNEELDLLASDITALNNEYSHYYNTEIRNARVGVSPAPFEKNWAELAMKRMLRYAAENGFDKIAWTTGEQQAERYSLGAVMQGLKAYKTSPNTYYVIPYNNGAIGEFVKEYTEKELAETFGKEIAVNIITNAENATEENPYEMTGDDLRIGGSGMKAFYDQMIPSFMNKYGKKWGVKVGEVTMPSLEENNTMHSIDVTDAMRESVMQGQPMFRISDYDRQFDALQSEYDALDKNDEKALNEWREKKASAVRDYLTHIKDRFGMRSELIVFNGADEEQMREAYNKVVASYKAKSNANPPTYEDFKKKSLRKDMVAMYRKNGDTITFNATADDLNDKMQFAETMFHEDAHRVSYGLYTSDEFEAIWKDAKKSKDRVAKVVDRLYGDENDVTKGKEYIAKAVGYLANKQKDSFMQFMRGEMPVDELLKKLRSNSKIAKLAVEETLNVIKDEYRVQVSRRGETRGMGGVGYGSGLQDTGVVLQGNGRTEQGGSADRDSRYRVRVLDSTLADMVGEESYNKFLDGVFRDADDSIRREMVNRAMQNGLDFRTATQEYLANLVNENADSIFLSEVKDLYVGTLEDAGIDVGDISDNELRYALWKNNQKDNGVFSLAEDVVMRSRLGVGNYTQEADTSFRVAPSTPSTGKARQMYDEAVRSHTKKNNVKKSENLWYHLREAYQDSMLSVQKLMEAVLAETGNTLRSSDDVYKAENQLSSKNKAEIEKWERDFMKPLQMEILDLIKKGASYEDIVEYLLAKHGLERNLEFSRREDEEDGKVWDGFVKRDFSGLTELTGEAEHFTEAAQQIVEEFEGKYSTDNLWSKINAATKESLKKSYDSGLMSKETYDKVANMFQYYIPLRGWDNNVAADQYEYMANKGMKILPALKTAKGRTSRADDPIATLGSVGESSIIQGNRNLMKQKFLNFAQNNPTSLLTVDEQWYEQNADGTWKPSNPEIPTDATADEVDAIIKAHEAKMETLGDKATKKRQGLNINLHTTKWEEEEHAVNVKRNGKEYKIYVNGNPIAAQAINGFTNPNANKKDSWEWIEQRATAVKNFMARAFTSMNPAFVLSNLARDIIWAGTSVAIKENADYARQYSKNISKAMTSFQLPKLVSKWKKGTLDMNDPIEKYFHEFITNGGETGFTQLNTVDDYKRNMERFIKEAQGGVTTKAKKGWRWIWDNVEFLNRSAEDTTRFMVYLTSRQMGRPISESIANAKDITVNFNKKGRGTMGANVLGFAYIFFNATIQSLANFGKLIANHPKKTATALTLFGASGMITPMVALAVQAMLSGDDDEPTYWDLPEWVRRNNIVIYVGGSGYVTIPLPHELRPFYGMGELAFSTLMGKEEPEVALQKAVEGFAGLMPFDFTGNAGNAIVNFTPTIAQPLVQLVVNKDYFGTPIYRKTAFNEQDPEWTKAYKSTNQLLVDATEFLNELTGGDEVKNGLIDLNPAVIEHLYEGYLGGMGKTINRAAKTFSMLWDEDARTWRNVPVASSFYQVSDERTSGSQVNREYFDAVDEADAIEHLYSGYRKRAKMGVEEYAEKLNELIESDAFKRYQKVNSYKKAIAKMNTVLKEADPTDREDIETRIMELKVDMLEELDAMDIK